MKCATDKVRPSCSDCGSSRMYEGCGIFIGDDPLSKVFHRFRIPSPSRYQIAVESIGLQMMNDRCPGLTLTFRLSSDLPGL